MLSATVMRRLEALGDISKQGKRLNGWFRLLEGRILWYEAYANIYANKGAITPGVDEVTLDGFSEERVTSIIKRLKDGTYQFQPTRRVYIPKKNGATRFLQTVISRGTRSDVFLCGKTLTTNLLTLGAIPNQSDERLITHPSCSDWSSIRKAG